jgi:hypothetical protein
VPIAGRRRRRAADEVTTPGVAVDIEGEVAADAACDLAETVLGRRPELSSEPEPVLGWGAHAYRLRLATDDPLWQGELVVSSAGTAAADVERAWLGVVRSAGFPAPHVVAHDPISGTLLFRQPGGTPLAERMVAEMMALPQLLAGFGRLHARLHALAVPAEPVASSPALTDVEAVVARADDEAVREAVGTELGWLAQHRPAVTPPVVCHGQFSPVHIYSDGDGDDAVSVPVNWSGAGAGDPELDVAATLTGFWSGALYIDGVVQRRLYRMARDPLASGYLTAYEAAAPRPLDEAGLRYWQAYHLCRLAADIARCARYGPDDAWDPAAAVVQPRAALDEIRGRVAELTDR